jgi:hypothetical protein
VLTVGDALALGVVEGRGRRQARDRLDALMLTTTHPIEVEATRFRRHSNYAALAFPASS